MKDENSSVVVDSSLDMTDGPLPMPPLSDLVNLVLVSLRQGIFFGVETRIPYAVTSILRPILFNKPGRPIKKQLTYFAEQTLQHGWIIARISVIFKLSEQFLARYSGKRTPEPWHTFVAGMIAGYIVMARDSSYQVLKKQINMAIGIRTIYAIMSYLVRQEVVPGIENSPQGYTNGKNVYVVLMWGFVMWHWRHQAPVAPGEMNPAQVKQMNFIYNDGDITKNWFDSTHVLWLGAILAYQQITG